MILLWAWSATARAAAASGVCHDMSRAQRTAAEWMSANAASTGLLEEVRLAIGAESLMPSHERTGTVLRARMIRHGHVRWTLVPGPRAGTG